MSAVPASEVEIKDPSNSKSLKKILFSVLLLVMLVGVFAFSMKEMKEAKKAKNAAEEAEALKIKNFPTVLDAVINDLNAFKISLGKAEVELEIATALDHIHSGVEELKKAQKAAVAAK